MRKIISLLFCVASSLPIITYSQNLYTEKDKNEFRSGSYSGCMQKQSKSELTNLFKDGVITKFCECYANEVTNDLFGNIDFQIAFSKRNAATIKSIADAETSREKTMPRFNACMDRVQNQYGGIQNILKNEFTKQPVTKIGLEGESRRSFIYSGSYACVTEAMKIGTYRKPVIEDYCNCALNNMADFISINDLIETLKSGEESTRMKKVSVLSISKCTPRLK